MKRPVDICADCGKRRALTDGFCDDCGGVLSRFLTAYVQTAFLVLNAEMISRECTQMSESFRAVIRAATQDP